MFENIYFKVQLLASCFVFEVKLSSSVAFWNYHSWIKPTLWGHFWLTSGPVPVLCCLYVRGVSSLTRTARCGMQSSRSSAPSASHCGMSTTMASSSQLEMVETPSSWRRSEPCVTIPRALRKECHTWRYDGKITVTMFHVSAMLARKQNYLCSILVQGGSLICCTKCEVHAGTKTNKQKKHSGVI